MNSPQFFFTIITWFCTVAFFISTATEDESSNVHPFVANGTHEEYQISNVWPDDERFKLERIYNTAADKRIDDNGDPVAFTPASEEDLQTIYSNAHASIAVKAYSIQFFESDAFDGQSTVAAKVYGRTCPVELNIRPSKRDVIYIVDKDDKLFSTPKQLEACVRLVVATVYKDYKEELGEYDKEMARIQRRIDTENNIKSGNTNAWDNTSPVSTKE